MTTMNYIGTYMLSALIIRTSYNSYWISRID